MPTCRHGWVAMATGPVVPAVRSGRLLAAPTRGAVAGRDDCGPDLAGCPPYGPGRTCAVGAASSRPSRPAIFAAPPSNTVGRHAHMPPWPGRDGNRPGSPGGAVRAAASRPYEGKAGFCPDRPDRLWVQGSPLLAGRAVGAKTAPRQRAMEDGCVCGARLCLLYGLPPQMGQGS